MLSYCLLCFSSAAARALIDLDDLNAEDVAKKAIGVAADMCIYTHHNFVCETMPAKEKEEQS